METMDGLWLRVSVVIVLFLIRAQLVVCATTAASTITTSATSASTTTDATTTTPLTATSSSSVTTTIALAGTSVSITTTFPQLTCQEPRPITGGAIISNGPYYANLSKVVFDCFAGYSMSGPSTVLCSPKGTWDLNSTQCVPINNQPHVDNDITIQHENQVLPFWLMIVLCVTFGLLCLLLLACVVALCMKMCGCWQLRCCKTRVMHSSLSWQPPPDEIIIEKPKVKSQTNGTKRKISAAVKPENVWMPHSHERRNINTSTK